MKIVKELGRRGSNQSVHAIVEVEPSEPADVEDMLRLLDGEIGHVGIRVELVATNAFEDSMITAGKSGNAYIRRQFGYPSASMMKGVRRYYEVFVSRD